MTATAVSSPPTAVVAPHAIAASSPRDPSAGTHSFDQQLHAARQQQEPAPERERAPSRKSAAPPSHQSAGNAMREPTGASKGKSPEGSKGSAVNDSSSTTSADKSAAGGTATTAPDSLSSLTSPMPATDVTANDEQVDPGRDDADDGDQDNSALAGNMLALLGLSAGVAFGAVPAKGDDAATPAGNHAGKTAATDPGAATLLQPDGVDSTAAVMDAIPANANAASIGNGAKLPAPGKAADSALDPGSALAMSAPPTTTAPVMAHALQLQPPAGSQAFSHELGQQIVWLTGQDVQQARIRLHPDDLGQLDVKISVTHDRVDVVFSAQHPAAVTAVQQSLSQLGQMLGQQGLSLGHAEVGQQDRGHGQSHAGTGSADATIGDAGELPGDGLRASVSSVGLLDAFA